MPVALKGYGHILKEKEKDQHFMKKHVVIDGNAFYEVDEECMQALERRKQGRGGQGKEQAFKKRSGRDEEKMRTAHP